MARDDRLETLIAGLTELCGAIELMDEKLDRILAAATEEASPSELPAFLGRIAMALEKQVAVLAAVDDRLSRLPDAVATAILDGEIPMR